ncbi:MAG: hypothetical protein FJ202_10615 [Gemmatimonadetes bacterium]|nr:hypothetical protein [Gemmatimonadota bacterium]
MRRGAVALTVLATVANAQGSTPELRPIDMQRLRPADSRGLNMFESVKNDTIPFRGFVLRFGGAFLQSYQAVTHENKAAPRLVNNVDQNKLFTFGNGFNNSVANLYLDAQLADGIRVAMTTYLSARHHSETWVKDGYLLVDKSPIDNKIANKIMEKLTVRFGQFEVNYGDMHFRRTDNGQAMYNPFVGNLIMDAMTTEIGGELYFKHKDMFVMGGVTNGESKGLVTVPTRRTAAYLAKGGFDTKLNDDWRVRLTGSMYTISKANNNVLFSGDRAGSRYYYVMENTTATDVAQAWSGQLNPGFGRNVKAFVINPFVKFRGLEVFANIETADGRSWAEATDRSWKQNAYEAVYRVHDNKLYFGGRYNAVEGRLANMTNDVDINRVQVGGGWYITPNILLKLEAVDQKYNKFPTTDIRNGGRFKGIMVEGAVGF